jgi:hypothetical protein
MKTTFVFLLTSFFHGKFTWIRIMIFQTSKIKYKQPNFRL